MNKIISDSRVVRTHTTNRINFNVENGERLVPHSLVLKVKYESPINEVLTVKGLTLDEWFNGILKNKIVTTEPSEHESYLVVQNTDIEYIVNVLFNILNQLIDTKFKLISLGWK